MYLDEKFFAILCIYLWNAVVQSKSGPSLQNLQRRMLPHDAVADLVVLADVIVRIKILVTELQVVFIQDCPVRFQ